MMVVLMRAVLLITLACASTAQHGKRFLQASSNATQLGQKAVETRSLQAIDFNSWDQISHDIAHQTWKWEKDGQKTDLTIYKYMARSVIDVIGDISSGKPWGQTFSDVATSLTPLISMANPLLGLSLGILFSFFGGEKDSVAAAIKKAMQSLYKQIMKEVSEMFQQEAVESQLLNVQEKLATTMGELADMPGYLAPFNASTCKPQYTTEECKLLSLSAKFAFWTSRESEFTNLINDVFGHECVNQAVTGPVAKPGKICREFQEKGAIVFQFPFAITHLQIILEIGKLMPNTELSNDWLCWAKHVAGIYYSLMKDSFDYFKEVGGQKIKSSCDYHTSPMCDRGGSTWKMCMYNAMMEGDIYTIDNVCNTCHAYMPQNKISCSGYNKCSVRNPMSGKPLPMQCNVGAVDSDRVHIGKPLSYRNLDLCKTGWRGTCTQKDFDQAGSEWENKLNATYMPQLQNVSKASQIPTPGVVCAGTRPAKNPFKPFQ